MDKGAEAECQLHASTHTTAYYFLPPTNHYYLPYHKQACNGGHHEPLLGLKREKPHPRCFRQHWTLSVRQFPRLISGNTFTEFMYNILWLVNRRAFCTWGIGPTHPLPVTDCSQNKETSNVFFSNQMFHH